MDRDASVVSVSEMVPASPSERGPHALLPSALAVSIVTDGTESTADVAQYMVEAEDTTVEGQI